LESLERWGWIVTIVVAISALTGLNLHDLQPSTYGIVAIVAWFLFVSGFTTFLFYTRLRSWYSAPELIGRSGRIALVSGYVFSVIGLLISTLAYPNYPSTNASVGAGIYIMGSITLLLSIRKMGQIAERYE
jgi:hypothetical protein